ncbi:MAG TPA: hypothetical protein PK074_12330 [Spirochaetales bacterium]|nr:hypothetical protein [Spirochaetales bacterium]HQG39892.1 hypothetical protein [Spirochaetales bacterium]HQK35502.1 hypothetical protein [Spirochaetales bacterium]
MSFVFLIIASLFALLGTFLDIISTQNLLKKGLSLDYEQNLLARNAIKKFGTKFFLIYFLVEAIFFSSCCIIFAQLQNWFANTLYVSFSIFYGTLRMAVAHHNYTGKQNILSKFVWKIVQLINGWYEYLQ